MMNNRVALAEKDMEQVAGGYIHVYDNKYELIDDYTGEVLGVYSSFWEADEARYGQSWLDIDDEQLETLRRTGRIPELEW